MVNYFNSKSINDFYFYFWIELWICLKCNHTRPIISTQKNNNK